MFPQYGIGNENKLKQCYHFNWPQLVPLKTEPIKEIKKKKWTMVVYDDDDDDGDESVEN